MQRNQTLTLSPLVQSLRVDDRVVIWHSILGNPFVIDGDSFEELESLEHYSIHAPNSSGGECGTAHQWNASDLWSLLHGGHLIRSGDDARKAALGVLRSRMELAASSLSITFLELIMSEDCNFRCEYCIHFGNLDSSPRKLSPTGMSEATARRAVDAFLELVVSSNKDHAVVNFGGGEPLLNWTVIESVLPWAAQRAASLGIELEFSLNTNGTLLTRGRIEVLKRHQVRIAISLDGLESGNDAVRKLRGGGPTYHRITRAIELLSSSDYAVDGFAATFTAANIEDLNPGLIDWALTKGMTEVRLDCDVIGETGISVPELSSRIMEVRAYGAARGVATVGFWSRPFENLWTRASEMNSFCGAVSGRSMCVSPAEDVYACGYSRARLTRLETIDELCDTGSRLGELVRSRLPGTQSRCDGCPIEGACAGGCMITSEFEVDPSAGKMDCMCDLYRTMTYELLREHVRASFAEPAGGR